VHTTRDQSPGAGQVEDWVSRVYGWVNAQVADDPAKKISRGTLRELVASYGLSSLRAGFAALQRRDDVQNPAGWLRVYIRSAAGRQQAAS